MGRDATSVGFIGVGEIASAIVEGLFGGEGAPPDVYLSPRGADSVAALARRHPEVRVCRDNQSVADAAELVVLAVRPESVDEALSEIRLAPGSVLVSAVAGVSHDMLDSRLGGDVTIVRAIPLPAVRHRAGITATLPAHPDVTTLFNALGGALEMTDPRAFAALSAASATISAHLHYLHCVADWVATQGVPPAEADGYVRSMFAGVGHSMAGQDATLAELVIAHETRGGLNEQLREAWFDPPTQAALVAALDAVLSRVTRPR